MQKHQNNQQNKQLSNVLVVSSLDPQGSAGISADILAINNAQSFTLPIISNVTTQNSQQMFDIQSIDSEIIIKQFDAIIQDSTIDIIKIGLITNQNFDGMSYILQHTDVKIVLDPIVKSSTHNTFDNLNILRNILPKVFLLTPNASELEHLTGEKNQQKAVEKLNIPWVLLTQTDNSDEIITHKLFKNNQLVKEFNYQKLDGNYHGSGCVLSSSIAAKLHHLSVLEACNYGLKYTYNSLKNPLKIGKMQWTPNQVKQTN